MIHPNRMRFSKEELEKEMESMDIFWLSKKSKRDIIKVLARRNLIIKKMFKLLEIQEGKAR